MNNKQNDIDSRLEQKYDKEQNRSISLRPFKPNTTVVFESEINAGYKGPHCGTKEKNRRKAGIESKKYAYRKQRETGYRLIQYYWSSYKAHSIHGTSDINNAKWGRTYITVNCVAIFQT